MSQLQRKVFRWFWFEDILREQLHVISLVSYEPHDSAAPGILAHGGKSVLHYSSWLTWQTHVNRANVNALHEPQL